MTGVARLGLLDVAREGHGERPAKRAPDLGPRLERRCPACLNYARFPLAKNQNTYEKHRREAEKKRKAEEKRRDKKLPKSPAPPPAAPPTPE